MKRALTATLTGTFALMLAACSQGSDNTFSPRDEDKSAKKSEDAGEPRGAAAAAALLDKTRAEANERKSAADDEKAARAFIDGLYDSYDSNSPINAFGEPRQVFEPQLAAAIEAIVKQSDDTGDMHDLLGADPICGCQDWGDFSHRIDTLSIAGDRATAKVTVTNFGETAVHTMTLVKTPAGWRIYELGKGFRAEALAG